MVKIRAKGRVMEKIEANFSPTPILQDLNIGFVGASKTGTSLAQYFLLHNLKVKGFYSYNSASALESAKLTGSLAFPDLASVVAANQIIFVTTKDDYLEPMWQQILQLVPAIRENKYFFHCSGSSSSEIFTAQAELPYHSASFHPAHIFTTKTTVISPQTYFTLEGDVKAITVAMELLNHTTNPYFIINKEDKVAYHLACYLASGGIMAILSWIKQLVGEKLPLGLFTNLSKQMLSNNAPEEIIVSGPLARADYLTMTKHFNSVNIMDKQLLAGLLLKLIPYAKLSEKQKQTLTDFILLTKDSQDHQIL
ncbi:MAG: DUF2520 domain-containing protein [Burkholderiales bacterium]